MSGFQMNAWYAAASSDEVGAHLLRRQLLGIQIVLYRTSAGELAALHDRCAHRFAPLSQGRLDGDQVACPYHGMRYAPDGRCVAVPGQDRVPPHARVRAFPALERHGLVFLWMGDAALADPASLVRIEQYGESGWGVSRGYKMFGCSLRLIMENLIDPAHTSFVHQRTIGNDAGNDIPLETRVLEDGTIECGRWICDSPPVPIVKRFAQPPGNVDRWQYYYVKPPCTSLVDFGSLNTGLPHTPAEQAKAPYRVLSYAFLTPQDDRSTHYFSLQLRNFAAEDLSVTQELEQMYQATFEEDRVLLEAIQEAEDADPEARPVLIASDAGVVRLRRAAAAQE